MPEIPKVCVDRSRVTNLYSTCARASHPLVLAVPRGCLTVADPIANALGLPLDVWVTGPTLRWSRRPQI